MGPYARFVLPTVIEKGCGIPPVRAIRRKLVPQATGRVLEIGVGTGLNIPHYDRTKVTELIALDPAAQMHGRAQRRADEAGIDVRLVGLSADRIPLDDGAVDTVVVTFTLCSIPDPAPAVAEMRRVLRPGGRLVFCEHGRAPDEAVRRWQRRLNPVWGLVAGGCHLDRDIPALLAEHFDVADIRTGYLEEGPRFAGYLYSGVVRA